MTQRTAPFSHANQEITALNRTIYNIVLLYTNGVTEAKNLDEVQYGVDRLCQILSQNWQNSTKAI
ncbi:SpoIIE family protein phosphatase [Roseofilum reptotaenium CS-1145]|uniref:Uncharacterized protein n=1 Tax=Roseofilum reptotaenium AO1-A TaxID=1925591 RepID=A0A1L9QLS9_9CYAN|nr:SpoIIE family protein phosphatase [Roseofilum reptotaenium]MDB9516022.1 SpoIIE family protein phosphatase [Roseofilum reptotaenium CS-1145]OJJ20655.1 hypothetical protein BI308_20855 [Roseofilum reptotaenium AO1-A]